ncbi:hypothetical protein GALMADRAFT_142797 [Galerina marginata CBS 339.88]|uniref:Uncharacterized protein n=1 Tax=Galerina marginata (strain CBS 339.88) TaxID=685588 RepID=A0A067SNL7_GALM3|nr:hypothetical protein GALMADRAFT_142797 [Galerina marginata CBS 339.88]
MPPKSGSKRPPGARDSGSTKRPPDPVFTADPAGGPPVPTAASAAVARYASDVPSQARQGPSRPSSRTSHKLQLLKQLTQVNSAHAVI